MSKVILDCGRFPLKKALEGALAGSAEADLPLVLELVFASEREIRALNARIRGVNSVTDVLSFPAAELKAGEPVRSHEHADCVEPVMGMRKGERVQKGERFFLGSVVICKKRAAEQAEEYGHSLERELCYLAAHGFLHCLGYDHETEREKRPMREEEEKIMARLGLGRDA